MVWMEADHGRGMVCMEADQGGGGGVINGREEVILKMVCQETDHGKLKEKKMKLVNQNILTIAQKWSTLTRTPQIPNS